MLLPAVRPPDLTRFMDADSTLRSQLSYRSWLQLLCGSMNDRDAVLLAWEGSYLHPRFVFACIACALDAAAFVPFRNNDEIASAYLSGWLPLLHFVMFALVQCLVVGFFGLMEQRLDDASCGAISLSRDEPWRAEYECLVTEPSSSHVLECAGRLFALQWKDLIDRGLTTTEQFERGVSGSRSIVAESFCCQLCWQSRLRSVKREHVRPGECRELRTKAMLT